MDYKLLLNTAVELGFRLLENGGEVYRVEESIGRFIEAYGVTTGEVFVIPSCVIVTVRDEENKAHTELKRVRALSTNLMRVEAINDLCRRACRTTPAFSEVEAQLNRILAAAAFTYRQQIFATALIASAFTLFYGGNLADALCASLCGVAIKITATKMSKYSANIFFSNAVCGAITALMALLFAMLGLAHGTDQIIIGTLMNLVPGVAITNVMRDIIAGDLLTAVIRLTEALLIAAALALGAALSITIAQAFLGGAFL